MPKYKIFISYAHIDNQPIANQKWVSDFFENLSNNIGVKLGRREYFDIWFDQTSLQGHARLTEEIKKEVGNSHIFVMIMSKGYIASTWCMDELNTFLESNSNSDTLSNIFIIQKDNYFIEKKPNAIQDVLGFDFWFIDKNAKCRTYRRNYDRESKYYDLIEDVSISISEYLESDRPHKQEKYRDIINEFSPIDKTPSAIDQIFLIFNQQNSAKYSVVGYVQCEDEFDSELIEFTFDNIYSEIEQENFIRLLVDEFESDVTIHFIIPPELFLVNFKQWRYRDNELVKRYHILLHNQDRFNGKIRKYKNMIEQWRVLFDRIKERLLRDTLVMADNSGARFDTRLDKIGVCVKQNLSNYEILNRVIDMAKIGLWQYEDGEISDYCRWVDGTLCLKDLNYKSRECDHMALLWDDMSLLEELKRRI